MKKYGSIIDGEMKRSTVHKLKAKFNMTDVSDKEFVEWWRRNHGTGYPIEIVEG